MCYNIFNDVPLRSKTVASSLKRFFFKTPIETPLQPCETDHLLRITLFGDTIFTPHWIGGAIAAAAAYIIPPWFVTT